jgi:16S rRNA pseudouridine516 synthase
VRLDRFLANMGCGTRTEVKQTIKAGKVQVNEEVARSADFRVDPENDVVSWLGEKIVYRRYIYLEMNKPAGVISATEDLREQTVLDLLDGKYHNRDIFPVGRLDKDTEGLLLLTNDGDLGHRLLSPKKHVVKRYFARVAGQVGEADQQAFREGIVLEDGYRTLPGDLEIIRQGPVSEVMVAIREGKFHQIKRMFIALNKEVIYLKRIAMGRLVLDETLAPGAYRELTDDEVRLLEQS